MGAVRGLEERGLVGEEDFLWFSLSFSSLFIDLKKTYRLFLLICSFYFMKKYVAKFDEQTYPPKNFLEAINLKVLEL